MSVFVVIIEGEATVEVKTPELVGAAEYAVRSNLKHMFLYSLIVIPSRFCFPFCHIIRLAVGEFLQSLTNTCDLLWPTISSELIHLN